MEIRLGTIGSNFIVHNLLRHVVKNPGYCYTAAYSRSEEKARALAEQLQRPSPHRAARL
jgi:predicted dehydrogenase